MTSWNFRGNWTLCAIAALAFMAACVAHEAVGHGGMCLATGGRITLLTSVYFHCSNGGALTDAAGPMMNLVVGIACWCALTFCPMPSPQWRVFLALAMAFNLFWGSSYFVYSAVTGNGDWAFVLRGRGREAQMLRAILMGAFGARLYAGSARMVAARLPSGTPMIVPWLVAGTVSCAAASCFAGPVLPAVREAALESFGAGAGLLVVAWRNPMAVAPTRVESGVAPGKGWVFAAIPALLVFAATLGRGLS